MHRIARTFTLLLLAAVATGCAVGPGSSPGSNPPSPSVEPSTDVAALTSTAWRLVDVAGAVVDRGHDRSIAFGADGSVAGNGGCNRFGGSATLGAGTIVIAELTRTEAGCADAAAQAIEDRFFQALDGAATWLLGEDDTLVIDGAAGRLTFVEG